MTATCRIVVLLLALGAAVARSQPAADADGPSPAMAEPPARPRAEATAPALLAGPRVSPTAAVFVSAVFPGWGQLATDNAWRAALAFGFEGWFLARMLMFDRKAIRYRQRIEPLRGTDAFAGAYEFDKELWELKRDNAWWAGGALFIIALDAYVGAHLDRFEQGPVPVPDAWEPGEIPQPIELPPAAGVGAPILRLSAGF